MDKIKKKFFHLNELKKGVFNCKDNHKKKELMKQLNQQLTSLAIFYGMERKIIMYNIFCRLRRFIDSNYS